VTSEGFKQLIEKIDALVDSQIRTDDGLNALRKRTEERFEELAASDKRLNTKMEELAASDKRLDTKMEELAASQIRTEETLRRFIRSLGNGRNNN